MQFPLTAILRSLLIYRAPGRRVSLDRLYGQFVRPGDLVFDIGSHVGDRTASFRRLGARVIAVEPQPAFARTLRLLHGRDPHVEILDQALAARPGSAQLQINSRNPTVSTLSPAFIQAAQGALGWEGQHWDREITVEQTTLDALIQRFGRPDFVKIDVEGFEAEVLQGLTQALPAVSFEFTAIQRDQALTAIQRCEQLGRYRYNAALGECHQLLHEDWLEAPALIDWLASLPDSANSGDVYARLQEQ